MTRTRLAVPELFNSELLRHYETLSIKGLDSDHYGTEPIYYLVGTYSDANVFGPSYREWMMSWCVLIAAASS